MNRFLKSFGFFVLFFGCFYLVFVLLWGQFASNVPSNIFRVGGDMNLRLKEVKQTKNIDVLFLGSSHSYRGFDPRIFRKHGISSFNLGSSSQTPMQTLVLLKRYLNQLNPKLVLIEVYPLIFSLDGVESTVDIVANDEIDLHAVDMTLKSNKSIAYNTLLYSFLSRKLNLGKNDIETYRMGEDLYVAGGFVQKDMNYFTIKEIKKRKLIFLSKQFEALDEILVLLKLKGMKVVLVNSAVTRSNYESIINRSEFDQIIRKKGIYLDFNNIMNLNDSLDFYDADHLNQNGVVKFNDSLIQQLERMNKSLKFLRKNKSQ